MIRILITMFFFQISIFSESQDFEFSPYGKMGFNHLTIETKLTTNINLKTSSIIFQKIDSSILNDSSEFKVYLQEYYEKGIKDTSEYFFIFNNSLQIIEIDRNNDFLVGVENARNEKGILKPVSFFYQFWCPSGGNRKPIPLRNKDLLIIRGNYSDIIGDFKTKAVLKIRTSSHGILSSKLFTTYLDEDAFFINTKGELQASRENGGVFRNNVFTEKK